MVPGEPPLTQLDKTKELVVDYRRQSREHTPITIDKHLWNGWPALSSSAFTSPRISHGLLTQMQCWRRHISVSSSWDGWGKFGTSPRILRSFYTCTVESILTGCITAWYGNSTAGNRRALQRVVRTARHIVGGELPSLQDIYTGGCTRKARRIIKDSSHPSHRLLSLLPSGRRFRSIRSRTSRLRDSFFPQAIRPNEQSQITHLHHTPTHTTCHALHLTPFNWTTRTHCTNHNLSAITGTPYDAHPRHCIWIICCTFAHLSAAQPICC